MNLELMSELNGVQSCRTEPVRSDIISRLIVSELC